MKRSQRLAQSTQARSGKPPLAHPCTTCGSRFASAYALKLHKQFGDCKPPAAKPAAVVATSREG